MDETILPCLFYLQAAVLRFTNKALSSTDLGTHHVSFHCLKQMLLATSRAFLANRLYRDLAKNRFVLNCFYRDCSNINIFFYERVFRV